MGINATCCASCCASPSDSSIGSRTPPNRSPVRAVRFISPVASAFGRAKKEVKSIPSNSDVAVNPWSGGHNQPTDVPSLRQVKLETSQITIPTEFEASPSPEVYRGKLPWSNQPIESTVSTPASEYDTAPAPEVHFEPHIRLRTSAPSPRSKAARSNDTGAFELPDTPTRQTDRHLSRESLYNARYDVGYQGQKRRSRAGEHCFPSCHIRGPDAVRLPRRSVIANDAGTHHTSTQSHSRYSTSTIHDRRKAQARDLVDLPMLLAHSLQYKKPRDTSESSSIATRKSDESELAMPKGRWRSSNMKTGASRPVSVSQSQFGRYHVFTILVEKDDADSLL